jgi:hypothetical protein
VTLISVYLCIMNRFLTAAILLLAALAVQAQRFHGGVMAGGVASQVQGDTYSGFYKLGMYGGAFVALDLGKIHTLQMEMEFIQKGSRDNADPAKGKYDSYLLRVNYIEVPLVYQVRIYKGFSFEAGPAMDVLVSSYEASDDMEIQNTVPLRPVTLNALAGLSYEILPKLKLDFRFIMSLTSIRNGETTGYYKRFGVWGQYNDLLAFTVWYRFK